MVLVEIIVENLFWRQPEKINMQKLHQFFKNSPYFNQATWINILYQLATEINHPLNIKYLHNKLYSFSLADRDEIWTAFIALESDQCPAIERLLTWCQKSSGQENIEPEALLLGAIAVSWLFTSTINEVEMAILMHWLIYYGIDWKLHWRYSRNL